VPLAQVGAAQFMPEAYSWQAAVVPLHTPLLPHELEPWSVHSLCGSRSPTIRPHTPSVPLPFRVFVHAWQVPAHAESQHTPSTQKVLTHCAPLAQALPVPWSGLQVPVPISQ
jgi:hypothetical protein